MRILLVMLMGLVLTACGQDYEEVYGIKIGAPLSSTNGYEQYNEVNGELEVEGKPARLFSKVNNKDFFQYIDIITVDDVVDTVRLSSIGGKASIGDIDLLLVSLSERWGDLTEYKQGAAILSPNSKFIGYIEMYWIPWDENRWQYMLSYSKEKPSWTVSDMFMESLD